MLVNGHGEPLIIDLAQCSQGTSACAMCNICLSNVPSRPDIKTLHQHECMALEYVMGTTWAVIEPSSWWKMSVAVVDCVHDSMLHRHCPAATSSTMFMVLLCNAFSLLFGMHGFSDWRLKPLCQRESLSALFSGAGWPWASPAAQHSCALISTALHFFLLSLQFRNVFSTCACFSKVMESR